MSRPQPLALAAGLFTVVPMPPVLDLQRGDARRALAWLPVVGLLLGACAGAVGSGVVLLSGAQLLAAVLSVVVLQLLVGGMHLDGLADTFDGLAAVGSRKAGRDAAAALQVMRQPDIGAMGVVAISCVLAVQIAALATAPDARSLFVLALLGPLAGRLAVLVASRRGVPAARTGGFGALFAGVTPPAIAWLQVVVGAGAAAALGWWATGPLVGIGLALVMLAGIAGSVGWTRHLVRVLGGVTGDVFGAMVEVTTTLVLLGGALVIT